MPSASFLLILHAHLPYVRHPEHPVFLEENWLYEAIAECYLPLLDVLTRLHEEGVPYRITLGVTPPLCEMLADDLLRSRFSARLSQLVAASEKELERQAPHPAFRPVAQHYRERFHRLQHLYEERWQGDLLQVIRALQAEGHLELITCAATHALLPLLQEEGSIRAQLAIALRTHQRHFGTLPQGIWLPECAYCEGLDRYLAEEGFRYFFLDSHGILYANPRPQGGIWVPVQTPHGVAVFARDAACSKQVWSAQYGYPGDPVYREFYRDLGYDCDEAHIRALLHPDGIRHDTGFKYHRITGPVPLEAKAPYEPKRAQAKAKEHAAHFLEERRRQSQEIASLIGRPPVIVAPYDAELFGHWWYEGPIWIEELLRLLAADGEIQTANPSDILAENPILQPLSPSLSSWGNQGYFETWLNGWNDWIYPPLHRAEARMVTLASRYRHDPRLENGLERALRQAGRELLLAQASDWPFMMTCRTAVQYAESRVRTHLSRFEHLVTMIEKETIDPELLHSWESQDAIFPDLDFRFFDPSYDLSIPR